ncbi:hypothetical protein SNEBB_008658 [Seison nebaliae]|nr:hypothetical protein SNEBB_008658 [Seison nebaliae]
MNFSIFTFVTVLLCINIGSLKADVSCYQCDGEQTCVLPEVNNVPVITCKHQCWKGYVLHKVYRGCGDLACNALVKAELKPLGGNLCCKTDKCNSGLNIQSSIILPLILSSLVLMRML